MIFLKRSVIHAGKDGDSVAIPLTRGFVTLVNPEDFERFGHLKWTAQTQGAGLVYAYRNEPQPSGKLKNIYLHRLIIGAVAGVCVDHVNGNALDNRRANLRLATKAQNSFNSRRRPNKFGLLGVHGVGNGKFRGRVNLYGRSFYTPYTNSPEEAARARDILARQLHGSFAVCNFNAA